MSKQSTGNQTPTLKTVRITRDAREALSREDIKVAISKYSACNWGDVSASEWNRNDEAYKSDGATTARYIGAKGTPFLIVTETGKQGATILLPRGARLKRAC